MSRPSAADLLALHGVRLKGFADTAAVAARFALEPAAVHEDLLDAQARGWVTRSAFADLAGWSLTETGRRRNEEQLREELDGAGGRADVIAVHERFLPWNARAARAFTAWQLDRAEEGGDRLGDVARALADIEEALTARLARFGGYHDRFAGALARAAHDRAWITGVEIDSAHRVWFELHEDLIATLGLRR